MSNTYNISNEQLLLIDILNGMYNDNLRQINTLNNSLQGLRENNNQIRNNIIQMLNNNHNTQNRRNNYRNNRANLNRGVNNSIPTEEDQERIYIDNVPYVIDSIQHYTLPSQSRNIRNNNTNNTNTREASNLSRFLQNFFQPIEIYPTQTQIEIATRNVMYADIVNPNNTSCPISLNNFNDSDYVTVIRYCGHIFNSTELNTWFRSNCRCPVCRYDIRNYNQDSSLRSRDSSNNSLDQNEDPQESVERNNTTTTTIPSQSNQNTQNTQSNVYLDLLNDFTSISNATDPTALLSLFNALQRRSQ